MNLDRRKFLRPEPREIKKEVGVQIQTENGPVQIINTLEQLKSVELAKVGSAVLNPINLEGFEKLKRAHVSKSNSSERAKSDLSFPEKLAKLFPEAKIFAPQGLLTAEEEEIISKIKTVASGAASSSLASWLYGGSLGVSLIHAKLIGEKGKQQPKSKRNENVSKLSRRSLLKNAAMSAVVSGVYFATGISASKALHHSAEVFNSDKLRHASEKLDATERVFIDTIYKVHEAHCLFVAMQIAQHQKKSPKETKTVFVQDNTQDRGVQAALKLTEQERINRFAELLNQDQKVRERFVKLNGSGWKVEQNGNPPKFSSEPIKDLSPLLTEYKEGI